jgi:hypothetical protein
MACQAPTTHLKKPLLIMDCDIGTGGDHCVRTFRPTASILLNEEARSTSM